MTYLEGALRVLRSARRPLATKEITAEAVAAGLLEPAGKTPNASMSAALYKWTCRNAELVKIAPLATGERSGSVHWTVRPS